MFVTVILTMFVYNILDSLFINAFRQKTKTKIVKIYVDEFGEEIKTK